MKTLVMGCDASGKSTFLDNVKNKYGDHVGESSRSEEAQLFKKNSLNRLVDEEFISQREALYLKLSHSALINMHADSEANVVTTDSSLVTRLSHDVMRTIVTNESLSNDDIIERWKEDEALVGTASPDLFVLTHAPFDEIRDRIYSRQQAGDASEKFWGFNSPFFLEAYQERWHSMFESLSQSAHLCMSIDTTTISPEESVKMYDTLRKAL